MRIDKNINKSRGRERFPVRKTFIKVDHISIPTLKLALENKDNVHTNLKEINEEFLVMHDGTLASERLNVVIGKRATGKTYLLNTIYSSNSKDDVKYIEQFYISKNSDENEFNKLVNYSYDNLSEAYLSPLKKIINNIINSTFAPLKI